jgi:hypothetical protein
MHIPGIGIDATRINARTRVSLALHAFRYEEWVKAATQLDKLQGNDAWKRDPTDSAYDSGDHFVCSLVYQ